MRSNTIPEIYGLLGHPVKHSLSPDMHSAAFGKLKLRGVYLLFETTGVNLEKTIDKIRLMNIAGFNVTVPYKERIIPYLDRLDKQASQIGAVNTVLNRNGKLIGYNTDSPGFSASLKNDLKFDPKGKNIFVIAAGGAARAIGFALAKKKASSIVFYDILKERSDKLANDIRKNFPGCSVSSVGSTVNCKLSTVNLLVNASCCGMKKSDPPPIKPELLPEGIVVYDIIYNPSPTRLVMAARARGIRAVNGLGMLLYQGALAFEIWTNRKAPVAAMRKALLKAIHGKSH